MLRWTFRARLFLRLAVWFEDASRWCSAQADEASGLADAIREEERWLEEEYGPLPRKKR